nr:MAG TPA: hypothetical protein [Bacteriophage sp.]
MLYNFSFCFLSPLYSSNIYWSFFGFMLPFNDTSPYFLKYGSNASLFYPF